MFTAIAIALAHITYGHQPHSVKAEYCLQVTPYFHNITFNIFLTRAHNLFPNNSFPASFPTSF